MLKQITLFLSTALLIGCSTPQTQIVVSPDFIQPTNQAMRIGALSLNVVDKRTSKHLVQIQKEGQAANLLNSQLPLNNVIEDTLQKALKSQNIQIIGNTLPAIDVDLTKALIHVDQTHFNYKAKSTLQLIVKVENNTGKLTKTYDHKSTSEGPLKADIAVLGRDFNQSLTKVLNQILADDELFKFING